MKTHHYAEIDVLYTIGVFLVIFGHSHSSDWSSFSGTALEVAIMFLYVFHMPLFFCIAGFLFSNSASLAAKGYRKWIGEKTIRLMTPYVVLSAVALIPKYYVEHHGLSGFTLGYLLEVLMKPRLGVWGHFWFLPALWLLYLIFGLGKKLLGGLDKNAALVSAVTVSIVLYFLPWSTEWLGVRDLKEAAIFFAAGILWQKMILEKRDVATPRARTAWAIAVVLCSMLLVNWFYQIRAARLLAGLLMCFACWQLASLIGQQAFATWVSRHNFTIYLYSWPFQAVMMIICNRLGLTWYATSACMFAAGFLGPTIMVIIYEQLDLPRWKWTDLVLGLK